MFAETLIKHAEQDTKIIGITGAMPSGTGLNLFEKRFPDRTFDVGIAEQHAVTFAAGLATEGYKPYAAIYSTFLQRAYDQVVHDVAIQSLPVRFAIDRAGLVGSDGPTHAGSFDITYLSTLPNFIVMAASDEAELVKMINTSVEINDKPSDLIIDDNLNVGVMWEAGRDSNAHDDNSINSESLASVFMGQENIICLDKEVSKDKKPDFVNEIAEYSDLLELAQLIKQLDVVVTVDHTVAHVAGALDINTILMLPCVPNWRWDMNHRNTSPWYRSIKLFRQQIPGDWSSVLNKVSESLLEIKNG